MPTKRNMKNYALVEVIQTKNYYELVKAKVCHNVEEIILSYVFYDSKRQTHACKLNIDNTLNILYYAYMNAYTITCGMEYELFGKKLSDKYKVFHTRWNNSMWLKTECAVCRKKFSNMKKHIDMSYYHAEDETQADYTDEWEWGGEICYKCNKRYNIVRLYEADYAIFIDFMHRLCQGNTKDERDEIFENYEDFCHVEWSDEDWSDED